MFQTILVSPSTEQFDLLRTRLADRVEEGQGETIYEVGVAEGEYIQLSMSDVCLCLNAKLGECLPIVLCYPNVTVLDLLVYGKNS